MFEVVHDMQDEELKRLAGHQVGRLEHGISQMHAQLASVSGWLSASLFALNGAGAIATMGAFDRLDAPVWSVSMFGAGVIFAILTGVLIQFVVGRSVPPAEHLMLYWRDTAATGKADLDALDGIHKSLHRVTRWNWVPPVMGYVSGILFLVGGTILAIDQAAPPAGYVKSCRRLQSRMLTTANDADRSRELWTALKCQWHD